MQADNRQTRVVLPSSFGKSTGSLVSVPVVSVMIEYRASLWLATIASLPGGSPGMAETMYGFNRVSASNPESHSQMSVGYC
jgi:hypothetical protein